MSAHRISEFSKSSFSYSVVLAILVSIGATTAHGSEHGPECALEAFIPAFDTYECAKKKSLADLFDRKSKTTKSKEEQSVENLTSINTPTLLDTSLCKVRALGEETEEEALQNRQEVNVSSLYKVRGVLSWEKSQHNENQNGNAFCYTQGASLLNSSPDFSGIAFLGEDKVISGLLFSNFIGHSGSAIYSEKDVLFERFSEGIAFSDCSSKFYGGAIFGDVSVHDCKEMVISRCKAQYVLSDYKDLAKGGGAISAQHQADSQMHPGRVLFSQSGDFLLEGNHADQANGGAIACDTFVCSSNHGCVRYIANQALSGGAISSLKTVEINGNLGAVEFIDNVSTIEFQPNKEELLGGGAIAAGESIHLTNNHALQCLKNSSQLSGGALLSKSVKISENFGLMLFRENTSDMEGGAIKAQNGVEINSNFSPLHFEGNKAKILGGAICCKAPQSGMSLDSLLGRIRITDNSGNIQFKTNQVTCSSTDLHNHCGGGALYGSQVIIANNTGGLNFSNNAVEQKNSLALKSGGGAVFGDQGIIITNNIGNVSFFDNNGCFIGDSASSLKQPAFLGGGALFSKQIEIKQNTGTLMFSDNFINAKEVKNQASSYYLGGGAIFGDQVDIIGNKKVLFSNNHVLGRKANGGAILSNAITMSQNDTIMFSHNYTADFGGAVCALTGGVTLSENNELVAFSGNNAHIAGGALASLDHQVSIVNNRGKVEFRDNYSCREETAEDQENEEVLAHYSAGGAIYAKTKVDIIGNTGEVVFSGNSSESFGGAILTGILDFSENSSSISKVDCNQTQVTIADNQNDVVFAGNYITDEKQSENNRFGGGAIYTQNLVIKNNAGSVCFYNNYAPIGGAVCISEKGQVVLEASGGDILFQGNRNENHILNGFYFFGNESKLVEISAAQDKTVYLADAIVFENLTPRVSGDLSPTLTLNSSRPNTKDTKHTGSVHFANSVFKIPQYAVLEAGQLVLSNGAELWLQGFKQEKDSRIVMSADTVLRIFDSEKNTKERKSPVDIHTISIDLSSFSDEVASSPQIVIPENKELGSNSVHIDLIDSSSLGYENHSLLNQAKNIPLISFKTASENGDVKEDENLLEELKVDISVPTITEDTYGHVGYWSEPQIVDGKLSISWMPTHYKLNPEKGGAIVINSLWSQYGSLRTLKQQQQAHNITTQRMEMDYSTNIWGAGLMSSSICRSQGLIDGFVHRSGGYVVGIDSQIIEDFLVGVSFSQSFGYTDSRLYNARDDQQGFLGSGYIGISAGSWLFKGVFIYSDIHNNLNTTYSLQNVKSHGTWDSRGVLLDASLDYRYLIHPRRFISSLITSISPFVEAEYTVIDFPAFVESGSEGRSFTEGRLQN